MRGGPPSAAAGAPIRHRALPRPQRGHRDPVRHLISCLPAPPSRGAPRQHTSVAEVRRHRCGRGVGWMPDGRASERGGQPGFWRDYLTRGDSFDATSSRGSAAVCCPTSPDASCVRRHSPGRRPWSCARIGKRPAAQEPAHLPSCFTFIEPPRRRRDRGELPVRRHPRLDDARRGDVRDGLPRAAGPLLRDRHRLVFENGGGVDKFVGDEVVAMFFPLDVRATPSGARGRGCGGTPAGDRPRRSGGPWIPVGAGVHGHGLGRGGRGCVAHRS